MSAAAAPARVDKPSRAPSSNATALHRGHLGAEYLSRIVSGEIQTHLCWWIWSQANLANLERGIQNSADGWTRPFRLSQLCRKWDCSEPGLDKVIKDGQERGLFECRREAKGFCFRNLYENWAKIPRYSPTSTPKKEPAVAEEAEPDTAPTSPTGVWVGTPISVQRKAAACKPVTLPKPQAKVRIQNTTDYDFSVAMKTDAQGLLVTVNPPVAAAPVIRMPAKATENCNNVPNSSWGSEFTEKVQEIAVSRTNIRLHDSQLRKIATLIPQEYQEDFLPWLYREMKGLRKPGYAVKLAEQAAERISQADLACQERKRGHSENNFSPLDSLVIAMQFVDLMAGHENCAGFQAEIDAARKSDPKLYAEALKCVGGKV